MLVLVGAVGACCPGLSPGPPESAFVDVDIRNSAFVPYEITIQAGDTVRWTNTDPVFHTVTSGEPGAPDAGVLFDSGDLIPFDSFTHQFDEIGEFTYFSRLDIGKPGLVGAKIVVVE